jgi:GNAT superfamily N-acetyltransferase
MTDTLQATSKDTLRAKGIVLVPVDNKKLLTQFIDFPHELFKNDPNYVPEIFIGQRDLLTPGKHPFHEHSEVKLFLVLRGGKPAGRIAAIWNRNHNEFNNTQDGFFGFFDCVNDTDISNALLDAAGEWLRQHNLKTMIGPVSFSTNETCGMLIEGFDTPPVVMMPYNRPYYLKLMDAAGMQTHVNLLAYRITQDTMDDRPVRMMEVLHERLKRRNVTIRPLNLKKFDEEVKNLREIYNQAWDKNFGFVPMTDNEFAYLAKDLKMIVDPEFCLVAEQDGKAIGFALCIPDINRILIKMKKGRLFPTGIFKLLLNKNKVKAIRVLALGVLEPYRKLGVEAIFYGDIMQKCREKGIQFAEASWILERNELMNNALININADAYKRYRIYEKAI